MNDFEKFISLAVSKNYLYEIGEARKYLKEIRNN